MSRSRTRDGAAGAADAAALARHPRRVHLLPARRSRCGSAHRRCNFAGHADATSDGWRPVHRRVPAPTSSSHALGVTVKFALAHRAGRAGRSASASPCSPTAPPRHRLLPHGVLVDGRHLGRRGLADVAVPVPAVDRRAGQHRWLFDVFPAEEPGPAAAIRAPALPALGIVEHLGQPRVHVHRRDRRAAEHPPRAVRERVRRRCRRWRRFTNVTCRCSAPTLLFAPSCSPVAGASRPTARSTCSPAAARSARTRPRRSPT